MPEVFSYNLLKEALGQLRYLGERLHRFATHVPHEAHVWTLLKLVFLKLYIEKVYTPIIASNYKHMYYVDLFAGTGINRYTIEGRDVYLPGSPVIAWAFARYRFDKMFLVDYSQAAVDSLRKVLEVVAPLGAFEVRCGKAETEYRRILEEISGRRSSHFFCFIDPFGYKGVTWEMLKDLIGHRIRGDFLILLQAGYIAMHIRTHGKRARELARFFGCDSWYEDILELEKRLGNLRRAVIEYFVRRLKSIEARRGREMIIETISVRRSSKEEHYYLVFVTNVTRRGNPWMARVMELKELVEREPERVETAMREVLGLARSIVSYL